MLEYAARRDGKGRVWAEAVAEGRWRIRHLIERRHGRLVVEATYVRAVGAAKPSAGLPVNRVMPQVKLSNALSAAAALFEDAPPAITEPPPGPRRRRKDERLVWLSHVAKVYANAVAAGEHPWPTLAWSYGITYEQVRDRVHDARTEGLLVGDRLTEKARQLIEAADVSLLIAEEFEDDFRRYARRKGAEIDAMSYGSLAAFAHGWTERYHDLRPREGKPWGVIGGVRVGDPKRRR